MRIVCISDTHGYGRRIDVPPGDVLVHAGDHTFTGQEREIHAALTWLAEQPHDHKLLIAGNHDWFFDPAAPAEFRGLSLRRTHSLESMLAEFPALTYLCDSSTTIGGVSFYGSPWQPYFQGWAFNFPNSGESRSPARTWAKIPPDVDVLITHGPPYGTLDAVLPGGDRKGDYALLRRVQELKRLRLHVFGHIHEGYGTVEREIDGRSIAFVNASINTRDYRPVNKPITADVVPGMDRASVANGFAPHRRILPDDADRP